MKLAFPTRRDTTAFTLVEVALCIGIVAFAMVAIIGIMPAGLQVQRDNREDTIISQEAQQMIEAVRSGTNTFVTNNFAALAQNYVVLYVTNSLGGFYYLTNAGPGEIVGLMCTPRYSYDPATGIALTNTVRGRFLAGTGPLGEQSVTDPSLRFSYQATFEIVPFQYSNPDPNFATNNASLVTNLHEFRMTLRWPVLAGNNLNPSLGNGRRVFRTLIAGNLARNDVTNAVPYFNTNGNYFYFMPSTYVSAQ